MEGKKEEAEKGQRKKKSGETDDGKKKEEEERDKDKKGEQELENEGKEAETEAQQPSGSGGDGGSLYSKFVTSFENALQTLTSTAPQPRQKLSSLDLEGVAAFIREERPEIVFMVGAGISTSAGIPDFRTPGTGLYDNLQQYNIPHPQAIFEINYFKQNPEPFFVLARELFHDDIKPTPAHQFMRLVEQKGLLRRCFTQNIDSLEYLAGISDDKIVTAHGSHQTSTCLGCRKKYGHQWMMERIKSTDPDKKVPKCDSCKKGLVKPDIVFFGESLPARFLSSSLVDLPKCELLIIMGTSLVVHPFASLVDNVPERTPRLLINLEPVGTESLDYQKPDNTRDVFWQGECDAGVARLARLLGWEQELNAMIAKSKKAEGKRS